MKLIDHSMKQRLHEFKTNCVWNDSQTANLLGRREVPEKIYELLMSYDPSS